MGFLQLGSFAYLSLMGESIIINPSKGSENQLLYIQPMVHLLHYPTSIIGQYYLLLRKL